MKKIFSAALCATLSACLFFPAVASAQLKNADKNADVKKIETANNKLTTMQCAFERSSKMAAIKDVVKAQGTFYFQSPGSLCMKYDNGETFVVANDKVSMTVGGKARTLKAGNHHVEDLSNTLLACVMGKVATIEGSLESVKTHGQNVVIKIASDMKVGRSKVKSIELAYDKKTSALVSLNLVEADGSYTLYELKEKTLGGNIDAAVFAHAKDAKGDKAGHGNKGGKKK